MYPIKVRESILLLTTLPRHLIEKLTLHFNRLLILCSNCGVLLNNTQIDANCSRKKIWMSSSRLSVYKELSEVCAKLEIFCGS